MVRFPVSEATGAVSLMVTLWNLSLVARARRADLLDKQLSDERVEFQRVIEKQAQIDTKTEHLINGLERDIDRLRGWVDAAEKRVDRSEEVVRELRLVVDGLQQRLQQQVTDLDVISTLQAENTRLKLELARMTIAIEALQERVRALSGTAGVFEPPAPCIAPFV